MHNENTADMSGYDRTMQLAREGNGLALGLLKECYEWLLEQGLKRNLLLDGSSEEFRSSICDA
jgi:hypothetical protein